MVVHQSQVRMERLGALVLLDIRGYISMDAGPAIEETYGMIDHERAKKVLLRFDPDTYFNSEGIKWILDILVQARKNNQQVSITGLSKHFEKIFNMVGITKLATLHENENGALEGLGLDGSKVIVPAFTGLGEE